MDENKNNNQLARTTTSTQVMIQPADLDYITKLAKSVKDSPLAEPFRTKDDKGNTVVSEGAIISNMVLGYELGLSPVASLSLGKKLNSNSYLSVLRGRELGLDSVSSMSKVYHIPTKNGSTIALAVDIIIAKMLELGIEIHYIRDYEPTPMYKDLQGNYVGHKWQISNDDGTLKKGYFLYIKDVTDANALKNAQKEGLNIIYQFGTTQVTSVRLVRKSNNIDMIVHYSIQEAIDAKLHRGFHSVLKDAKGQPVYIDGKDNWNSHPATHLRHRPLSIGGRIVAADVLMGNYSIQEVIEIIDDDNVKNEADLSNYQYQKATEDIEIIEDNK